MTGDEYGGWFRDVPAEQRPDWAQKQIEDANNRQMWEDWALGRLPEWQALVEPRQGQTQPPCMGIGIFVDENRRRYGVVAISGDNTYTQQMIDAKQDGEHFAFDIDTDLHAEQRLARTAERMRERNKRAAAKGRPLPYPPGVQLESVAASFPICRRRCVPELQREGTRPLTEVQPEPAQKPQKPGDPQAALKYDQTQQPRRGRKPKR